MQTVRAYVLHPWLGITLSYLAIFTFARIDSSTATPRYLNPPPEQVELFHFGFKDALADSLWLRWIQDNDICQTYLKPVEQVSEPVNADEHELMKVPRYKICDNSWGFKMLDAVTKLSPKFDMPYLTGGPTLAILIEDFPGATVIFERGLANFPNDWNLLYRAAFHWQYDLKDIPKAAELLIRCADAGGPIWLRSTAARLYELEGQAELGLRVLEEYRKTIPEDRVEALKVVDKRIADWKERLRKASP